MREVEIYQDVPDGSILEVSFAPEDAAGTASVLFITSGNVDDQVWPDADLRPGPKRQPLEAGNAYMLELRFAFLAAATVTITAQIIKPDGSVYSTPKIWEIAGSNGDIPLRILFIRMAF